MTSIQLIRPNCVPSVFGEGGQHDGPAAAATCNLKVAECPGWALGLWLGLVFSCPAPGPSPSCFRAIPISHSAHTVPELQGNIQDTAKSFILFFFFPGCKSSFCSLQEKKWKTIKKEHPKFQTSDCFSAYPHIGVESFYKNGIL